MSYSIVFGSDEVVPLASVAGWRELSDYVEQLDVDQYPKLTDLVEWAVAEDLQALATEIESVVAENPPDDDVASTLQELLTHLKKERNADVCFVTDGQSDSNEGNWESEDDETEAVKKKTVLNSVSVLMQ